MASSRDRFHKEWRRKLAAEMEARDGEEEHEAPEPEEGSPEPSEGEEDPS